MIRIRSETQFEQEVINSQNTVVADFYARWCGPCKALAKLLDEMDQEKNAFQIAKVDVEELPGLAEKYRVVSVPTILVFKNQKCINRSVGLIGRNDLEKLV